MGEKWVLSCFLEIVGELELRVWSGSEFQIAGARGMEQKKNKVSSLLADFMLGTTSKFFPSERSDLTGTCRCNNIYKRTKKGWLFSRTLNVWVANFNVNSFINRQPMEFLKKLAAGYDHIFSRWNDTTYVYICQAVLRSLYRRLRELSDRPQNSEITIF